MEAEARLQHARKIVTGLRLVGQALVVEDENGELQLTAEATELATVAQQVEVMEQKKQMVDAVLLECMARIEDVLETAKQRRAEAAAAEEEAKQKVALFYD